MNDKQTSRRRFLARSAAGVAAGWTLTSARNAELATAAATDPTAAELIAGKDPRLIVHSATPAEMETPLALLAEHRVTPVSLLFVRNNQTLAGSETLAPSADENWTVEIAGLVDKQATPRLKDLISLPQVEHEIVLQCSGNGRAMFSAAAPAKGAPWQCGAMGNVRFAGVPLRAVCEHVGIKIDPRARFLSAAGKDLPLKPDEADFEHSIPLADALAHSFLALSLNGAPIPAVHGGPVRLITPGYYATMNIKWLGQLRFEAEETANHHQVRRYRTPKEQIPPGSAYTTDLENSDANWRMRTKSVIFAPLDGQSVAAGQTTIRGVAWNDGRARIETVLVATGTGRPWQHAKLDASAAAGSEIVASGENRYGWQHWAIDLELGPGEHQIAVRAIDALGRSQPLSPAAHWNPAGYAFNGLHVIKVIAT